jgi:Holliday junction resolvase RusA-like endonuclease
MRTIVLSGEPKSTQYIDGLPCRGRFPQRSTTPEGKRLKWECQLEARAQLATKPRAGDVEASVRLYFGTRRRADWDNHHKLWIDALNGIAYDSQIRRANVAVAHEAIRGSRRGRAAMTCKTASPFQEPTVSSS